ncbi:MAG: polysaccharide deacetylase family protein [Pseudomonadota bacterium]
MADLDYVSQKITGVIDKFLCEKLHKRTAQLPTGKYVSLCFDDFPKSAAETAAPMIEARGWRATWYVAGCFMGTEEANFGTMFDADDLAKLHQNGHDFGCHTFDHVDCRGAELAEIRAQCERSEAFLAEHGINEIKSFAFPFGSADLEAKRTMLRSDLALRGVNSGTNRGEADLGMLRACGLQDNCDGTGWAKAELDKLEDRDGWVIIFTHDVRSAPSAWGVTPDDYQDLLDHIERTGAEVVTVGEMTDRIAAQAQANDANVAA